MKNSAKADETSLSEFLFVTYKILFFRFVEPKNGEVMTIHANQDRNKLRIDSVKATGNCCFEIESNDGDYETVDPAHPSSITIFYIHKIYVFNSCPY